MGTSCSWPSDDDKVEVDKDVVNEPLLDKVEVSVGEVEERLDGWFLMCCLSLNGLTMMVSGDPDCRSCYFGSEWSRPEQSWPFGFCSISW